MAAATVATHSVSSMSTRRLHNQSQLSNISLNQNFSLHDPSNFSDSSSVSSITMTPLVTIIYSNTSSSLGIYNNNNSRRNLICQNVYVPVSSKSITCSV
ncbi:hypothetical protein I4U23_028636 [Adineta vaga]|nr:hypothetical protein I4U23_028636 [Adineta vaga]